MAETALDDIAVVYFGSGLIYEVGNGQWVERDLEGKQRGRYVEIRRADNTIVLEDPQTQLGRELNVGYGYIFFSEPGGPKTPVHQITDTRPASEAEYHRVNIRIGDQSRCLDVTQRTFEVPESDGSGTVRMQRYDPEFVACSESISQRWSIREAAPVDGKRSYMWRSQRAELSGLDICLSSRGRNGVPSMLRCTDHASQRWIHPAPNTQPFNGLHSAADAQPLCVLLELPGNAGPPPSGTPLVPKLATQCADGERQLAPAIRLQRIVD